jgi:hypothetical protein
MDALRVRYVSVLKYIKKRCWRLYGIRLEFNLRDCVVGTVHPLIRLSAVPVFVVFFSTLRGPRRRVFLGGLQPNRFAKVRN